MNLRKKLLTAFGGLALLALVTAGVTVWAIAKWQDTEDKLQSHYLRSLLLQRVRAAVFRAVKEVPDAVVRGDKNAKQQFEKSLKPVEQDFKRWADLAHDEEERKQVQQVRKAYEDLVRDSRRIFDLVKAGRNNEAFELMEGKLEKDFVPFENLTEKAVASDQNYRTVIRAQTQGTRQTADLVLAIAAFGIISLILLLAAYLASDLFAPLGEVKEALDDVARGDLQRRLDEERDDELGAINQAFNRMMEAIAQREQGIGLAAVPANSDGATDSSTLQNIPSRLMLHQLVCQLRSQVSQMGADNSVNGDDVIAIEDKQALVDRLDRLLQVVARVTEFSFPLDLNLARTDIRALVYEVLLRFQDEFIRRGISFELDIAPEVNYAVVDRLKLREAVSELVRNALAALPERGGRLGIRSSIIGDGTQLSIEVADNGTGAEQPLIDRAFSTIETADRKRPSVGLKLTKAIVEQHGGNLAIESEPGQGTYVQIQLPLRE
ncbi:ATP-binding protein [Argonema antarcticum]|uniref:ATP-binding protein n=1 Tax=Argonema antarcticum TaxID=2942763 RepID=UPI0020125D89|nr:ATP-binding protein [Argonema antarcticum]MCL1469932.1 HAMP domain-containing protein [Argonema antarcticum A004/B2]